ncbi:MAG: hypothetical protein ACFBSG_08185 [Leptolyngbyaceae cyanobacterium]
MAEAGNIFFRANYRCRQRAYKRWQEGLLKRQILRSQIGFVDMSTTRPPVCTGCTNYHGHAYGLHKDQRVQLICAMHPYGWQGDAPCPDWCAEATACV